MLSFIKLEKWENVGDVVINGFKATRANQYQIFISCRKIILANSKLTLKNLKYREQHRKCDVHFCPSHQWCSPSTPTVVIYLNGKRAVALLDTGSTSFMDQQFSVHSSYTLLAPTPRNIAAAGGLLTWQHTSLTLNIGFGVYNPGSSSSKVPRRSSLTYTGIIGYL